MSANFLTTSGSCMGLDGHTYFAAGGPVPIPVPLVPHLVVAGHGGPSRTWRIAKTVTTDGMPVLQGNWAMMLVAHIPNPPAAPHPIEPINLLAIILGGSATPQLTAHSVVVEGGALLTAISGAFGMNLDCADFPAHSEDVNVNTVMTTPTHGDYVAAVLSTALSWFYAWLGAQAGGLAASKMSKTPEGEIAVGAVLSVALAIAQTSLDLVNQQNPNDLEGWKGDPGAIATGKATAWVQGLIDGAHY